MKQRIFRISGYIVAVLLGAVFSSVHVHGDNPLPEGGQITQFASGSRPPLLGPEGVCTGHLNQGNGNCDRPWFNSLDVSALYAANSYQQLVLVSGKLDAIATKLDTVHQDNVVLDTLLKNQVVAFNNQMQKSIAKQFDSLPPELVASPAMQKFAQQIHDQVMAEVKAQIASAKPSPK